MRGRSNCGRLLGLDRHPEPPSIITIRTSKEPFYSGSSSLRAIGQTSSSDLLAGYSANLSIRTLIPSPLNERQLGPIRVLKTTYRFVEGFRAPIGVLNPDRYDLRIGMVWAMGISDSVRSAVPTWCHLTVVRTA